MTLTVTHCVCNDTTSPSMTQCRLHNDTYNTLTLAMTHSANNDSWPPTMTHYRLYKDTKTHSTTQWHINNDTWFLQLHLGNETMTQVHLQWHTVLAMTLGHPNNDTQSHLQCYMVPAMTLWHLSNDTISPTLSQWHTQWHSVYCFVLLVFRGKKTINKAEFVMNLKFCSLLGQSSDSLNQNPFPETQGEPSCRGLRSAVIWRTRGFIYSRFQKVNSPS